MHTVQNGAFWSKCLIAAYLFIVESGCGNNPPSPQSVVATKRDKRWNLDERVRTYRAFVDHAQLTASKVVADYQPTPEFQGSDINDLQISAVDVISGLPGVSSVTVSDTDQPTSRIIHLISLAVPSKADFLIVLKQMADGGVSQSQLDSLFDEYLLQVKLVQIEDVVIMRCLAERHGLRRIYIESTGQRDFTLSWDRVKSIPAGKDAARERDSHLEMTGPGLWADALKSGYLGELQDWQIADVSPRSSDAAVAIPVYRKINDKWRIVHQRGDQTMAAEVKLMLVNDRSCLIVGDANDFSESVSRVAGDKCEYIRVYTKRWHAASPLDPNIWGR